MLRGIFKILSHADRAFPSPHTICRTTEKILRGKIKIILKYALPCWRNHEDCGDAKPHENCSVCLGGLGGLEGLGGSKGLGSSEGSGGLAGLGRLGSLGSLKIHTLNILNLPNFPNLLNSTQTFSCPFVTAEPFRVRCGGETRQGESEDASRRDVSLKPKEASDDSIAPKRDFSAHRFSWSREAQNISAKTFGISRHTRFHLMS